MSSSASAGLVPGPSIGPLTTPTKRAAFAASADAGPSRARPAGVSPAYSSRRHSLYGIEDRIVIDPGSRIWKVGFSGEPDPRSAFYALDMSDVGRTGANEAWDLDPPRMRGVNGSRSEGERLIGVRVLKKLRETFVKHLMTDSKARKVIVIENTFLPIGVKEHIARALFDNLQVPSVSFTPSSLLSLAACGRITGLVVDVGWLESTVTPVFHSRPLYNLARSTPIAGRRSHKHLRVLLQHHANYIPAPSSLSHPLDRPRTQGIPSDLLTDELVQKILTEGCFVGDPHVPGQADELMEVDQTQEEGEAQESARIAQEWKDRYGDSSSAKDMRFSIPFGGSGLGPATIIVPGWIRERAAEILFADDDSEEPSIPRLILDCILKLPIDLRPTLISSMLIVGGTASLPGFIPRLRISLLQHLLPPPSNASSEQPKSPLNTIQSRKEETTMWRKKGHEPYKEIYGLASKVAIINDPAPLDGEGGNKGGKAPRWTPGLMSWVGGSLAGALKTSSAELTRETYDTNVSLSINRGENYKEELEISEIDLSTSVGVNIDDLKVGQAVRYQIDEDDDFRIVRKRGWKDSAGLSDWSRSSIKT
ncbi:uncharacterized protein I303_108275 [Kwoniella dejecticola CBS 10117]|uniref:Actin-like ATPase domain-containing protein n=1 Tax=Kwoniella dejecticola CBS 10117 TaxID=1296121 RepID=A0A1A5ZXV2_9TREE|nr:uncharacterized protein I303_07398 [Kwoniella dejecticola CBS 10117]OBR82636.1 hypothetical protein I303_07398 [Kwoniella dejecticola CBS 10117]